jgi:protein tyrosine phosphatase
MILEQNVTLIVSVCKLEENGRAKCHRFWPEGSSTTDKSFKGLLKPGF